MTGYVYAIQAGDAVKIGWATEPVRRLSELNVGSPEPHKLLGFVAATKNQERELHLLLSPWRIRGEWFSISKVVRHFIDQLPTVAVSQPGLPRARAKVIGAPCEADSARKALKEAISDSDFTAAEISKKLGGKDFVRDFLVGRKNSLGARTSDVARLLNVGAERLSPRAAE